MKQSFVYKMLEVNNKIDEQGCQVDPLICAKIEKKLNTIFLKGDSNQKLAMKRITLNSVQKRTKF